MKNKKNLENKKVSSKKTKIINVNGNWKKLKIPAIALGLLAVPAIPIVLLLVQDIKEQNKIDELKRVSLLQNEVFNLAIKELSDVPASVFIDGKKNIPSNFIESSSDQVDVDGENIRGLVNVFLDNQDAIILAMTNRLIKDSAMKDYFNSHLTETLQSTKMIFDDLTVFSRIRQNTFPLKDNPNGKVISFSDLPFKYNEFKIVFEGYSEPLIFDKDSRIATTESFRYKYPFDPDGDLKPITDEIKENAYAIAEKEFGNKYVVNKISKVMMAYRRAENIINSQYDYNAGKFIQPVGWSIPNEWVQDDNIELDPTILDTEKDAGKKYINVKVTWDDTILDPTKDNPATTIDFEYFGGAKFNPLQYIYMEPGLSKLPNEWEEKLSEKGSDWKLSYGNYSGSLLSITGYRNEIPDRSFVGAEIGIGFPLGNKTNIGNEAFMSSHFLSNTTINGLANMGLRSFKNAVFYGTVKFDGISLGDFSVFSPKRIFNGAWFKNGAVFSKDGISQYIPEFYILKDEDFHDSDIIHFVYDGFERGSLNNVEFKQHVEIRKSEYSPGGSKFLEKFGGSIFEKGLIVIDKDSSIDGVQLRTEYPPFKIDSKTGEMIILNETIDGEKINYDVDSKIYNNQTYNIKMKISASFAESSAKSFGSQDLVKIFRGSKFVEGLNLDFEDSDKIVEMKNTSFTNDGFIDMQSRNMDLFTFNNSTISIALNFNKSIFTPGSPEFLNAFNNSLLLKGLKVSQWYYDFPNDPTKISNMYPPMKVQKEKGAIIQRYWTISIKGKEQIIDLLEGTMFEKQKYDIQLGVNLEDNLITYDGVKYDTSVFAEIFKGTNFSSGIRIWTSGEKYVDFEPFVVPQDGSAFDLVEVNNA